MIVGVDPGLDGAIVYLPEGPDKKYFPEIVIFDMPTVKIRKGKRIYDWIEIKNVFFNATLGVAMEVCLQCGLIVIEQTQPMPKGRNAQASHGLGLCEGFFRGLCVGSTLPYVLYRPKIWQKHFGITKAKGDLKVQSYQIAASLHPEVRDQLVGPRGGRKDGRCDALLMAEYGRIQFRT